MCRGIIVKHQENNDFTCYQQELMAIIFKLIPHCKIYLSGSRARKSNRAGSDIDLALDANKKIDLSVLAKINESIEESKVPFFVDVVDLCSVDDDFKEKITKDMIPWKQ